MWYIWNEHLLKLPNFTYLWRMSISLSFDGYWERYIKLEAQLYLEDALWEKRKLETLKLRHLKQSHHDHYHCNQYWRRKTVISICWLSLILLFFTRKTTQVFLRTLSKNILNRRVDKWQYTESKFWAQLIMKTVLFYICLEFSTVSAG